MKRIHLQYMDPQTESRQQFSGHVIAWKRWWCLEGRMFDNGCRHPDYQLENPPINAQNEWRHLLDVSVRMAVQRVVWRWQDRMRGWL